jgi:hypothetical protein
VTVARGSRTKNRSLLTRSFRRSLWLVLPGLFLISFIASCGGSGGGGGTTPPPTGTTVTISPTTLTISTGARRQFTATVTGTTSQLVAWKVNGIVGGTSTYGLISQEGVYIAPTAVPSPATVNVTAASFSDLTKTATASVTIQAGSGVQVIVSGHSAVVAVPTFGSHAFSATVTGTLNTAVTWMVNSIAGGSARTGTITASGLYYAPHSVPVSTNANNDGRATDVIVTAVSQADATASDSAIVTPYAVQQARYALPIPLGTSGGNGNDSSSSGSNTYCCSGTIGSLVSRGGKLYLLSNTHVLARSDLASAGEPVVQPGLVDTNCGASGASLVANLSQFANLETGASPHVDAAMAEIVTGAVDPLGTIVQLGGTVNGDQPTDGTPNPGPGVVPTVGRAVAKSGAATGLTCATIMAVNTSIQVEYNKGCNSSTTFNVQYRNQVYIATQGFCADGDSGSLIVTQDTADPVGLLYGGSDTDTVANPVADVLQQLADPGSGEKPLFVGDASVGPHAVAACSLPQHTLSAAATVTTAESAAAVRRLTAATAARDAHAPELLARPEVRALGVGASYDHPGEPAVLLFVDRSVPRAGLPAELDGIRTRAVEGDAFVQAGVITAEASAALERTVASPQFVSPVTEAEVGRVRIVHEGHVDELMRRPDIQAVGITSSADSPGEAALLVVVVRGMTHEPIPVAIDGVRTRVRETSLFHAK